jgi:hypothetical protein
MHKINHALLHAMYARYQSPLTQYLHIHDGAGPIRKARAENEITHRHNLTKGQHRWVSEIRRNATVRAPTKRRVDALSAQVDRLEVALSPQPHE